MLALGAPIADEFPGRLPPTLHLPSILLFNFWVTDEPWFPGTFSPRSLAYLNKLPTAYQEKFCSIHSLREHPALESPDFRHSGRRRQRYKVALIGRQYPFHIYGQIPCGPVLPIVRSLISYLPIMHHRHVLVGVRCDPDLNIHYSLQGLLHTV